MAGRVDARALVVRDGATGIAFAVDCGTATATLDPGGEPHRLRVLSWGEKCTLARFADAGAEFIERQFVAISGGGAIPEDPSRRAAATALALWLHGSLALPLDPPLLGEVTIGLCAALGIGPAELATLPAPEVEALWHAVRTEATDAGAADGHGLPAAEGVTRILIQPDPPARAEPPPQAEPSPDPETAKPNSAATAPLDGDGAAAEPEAVSARATSIPVPAAPRAAETARGSGSAEAVRARPGSIPAPAAPQSGTRAAATATGDGRGIETAAEATKAVLRSGTRLDSAADRAARTVASKAGPIDSPTSRHGASPPVTPRGPTTTPGRESDRSPAVPALPSASGPSSGAGDASAALQPRSDPPPRPPARFRLVPARESGSDVRSPFVGDGRPPAGRSSSGPAGHEPPPAPSAATAVPVRTSPDLRLPGTRRSGRNRSTGPAAAAEAVGPDDISACPADQGVRPTGFPGPAIAGADPVSPRALEASSRSHEPAGGGLQRATNRPKSQTPRLATPRVNPIFVPAPETEAAMPTDSRLRALIDIVSRVPETPSDPDRNPEAMFDVFSERLAEAASELGLADGV